MKGPGISDKVVCTPDGTNCLAATNATWAKEHGHSYDGSGPQASQGVLTPPEPPARVPARAVRALSAPPPNQVGPQGGQQPPNHPKCQHLPPDSPPPPGYGDGSTAATTMVTSTTRPTKAVATTAITTSGIATVTATKTVTGSSTTIFAGVRTGSTSTSANLDVPGFRSDSGPGPIPGNQGVGTSASIGNGKAVFKGPGPATHEITWENVPINKSSATIAGNRTKYPFFRRLLVAT